MEGKLNPLPPLLPPLINQVPVYRKRLLEERLCGGEGGLGGVQQQPQPSFDGDFPLYHRRMP